jgi:hypothetical protein
MPICVWPGQIQFSLAHDAEGTFNNLSSFKTHAAYTVTVAQPDSFHNVQGMVMHIWTNAGKGAILAIASSPIIPQGAGHVLPVSSVSSNLLQNEYIL